MHSTFSKTRGMWRQRFRVVTAAIASTLSLLTFKSVDAAPATSDPNPVQRQLEERQLDKRRAKSPQLKRPALFEDGGAASGESFSLRSVSISGATTVGKAVLEDQLTGYLGGVVTPADLRAITKRLTDVYQAQGYFLSRAAIAPQDVADGHLRIRIIEGHVAEVRVTGSHLERYRLAAALAPISNERPITLATFERTLLLVSDTPGIQILDTNLEEMTADSGAYRLTVSVSAKPVSAALTIDNRTAEGLADVQAIAAGALASALLPRDEVSVATATTSRGFGELAFVGGNYEVPLGVSGWSMGAFASHSILAPGDERRLVGTETRSDIAGVKVGYTVVRSLEQTMRLSLAFAMTRAEESTNAGLTYDDQLHTVTLGANYQVVDPLGGFNVVQLTARQGLDVGDATGRWDAFSSRYDASGVFSKAALFASRYQPIEDRWFARASVLAQVTADPLLSSEQLYLGGSQFGRAYHSGEFSGDHGVALAVEAGMILPWRNDLMRRTEVFGFVDGGFLGFRGEEYDGHVAILSAGAGFRASIGEYHSLQLELALPVDVGSVDDEGGRVFFSFTSAIQGCTFGLGC